MNALKATHRLLFQALLDIRDESRGIDNKTIYHLADLFHNVVLQLEAVAEGNTNLTYEDILVFVKERARSKGCEKWVTIGLRKLRFAVERRLPRIRCG